MNYFRLQNLPKNRAVCSLVPTSEWSANTYTFGRHAEDMLLLKRAQRWLWILGGGFIKNILPRSNRYEMLPEENPFQAGERGKPGIDKDNPMHCLEAYHEFKHIESHLPRDCLKVFTDGSAKDNRAGSGAAIYLRDRVIHEIISPVGDLSVAYAELFAIYSTLRYLHKERPANRRKRKTPVHIFTDSKYAQETLCNYMQ